MTYKIEFIDNSPIANQDPIVCPMCKDTYTHFLEPRSVRAWPRGGTVAIPMYCESGDHHWKLHFGHHKGQTFTWYTEVPVGEIGDIYGPNHVPNDN